MQPAKTTAPSCSQMHLHSHRQVWLLQTADSGLGEELLLLPSQQLRAQDCPGYFCGVPRAVFTPPAGWFTQTKEHPDQILQLRCLTRTKCSKPACPKAAAPPSSSSGIATGWPLQHECMCDAILTGTSRSSPECPNSVAAPAGRSGGRSEPLARHGAHRPSDSGCSPPPPSGASSNAASSSMSTSRLLVEEWCSIGSLASDWCSGTEFVFCHKLTD